MLVESLTQFVFMPSITAQQAVKTERNEVVAERDAFREFRKRVVKIPVQMSNRSHPFVTVNPTKSKSERLPKVRSAYRDTVIDVPHYERQYG